MASCNRYVGNIHPNVTDSLLAEVFQSIGPLEGCKLIHKEKVALTFLSCCGAYGEMVIVDYRYILFFKIL